MRPRAASDFLKRKEHTAVGQLYLNTAQYIVVLLSDPHQLLFAAIFVQRFGRRQSLLHVHSLGVCHYVRHTFQQQIIGALNGGVAFFIKLLTLQILQDKS